MSDDWPSRTLRVALEDLSAEFHTRIFHELHQQVPSTVWHYTNPSGLIGVLTSGNLWLTSTLSAEDRQEVHWGNTLICAAALRLDEQLGGHPALDALLNDHTSSLFLREAEVFIACFTDAADCEDHWSKRYPDGAALVFDSAILSKLSRSSPGGSKLLRVQYDSEAIRRRAGDYYSQVIQTAQRLNPPPTLNGWRALAQWLMEPGILSFFAKRRSWAWEQEFRLVARNLLPTKRPPVESPRRRLEVELRTLQPLKEIVLGPKAHDQLEHTIRNLLASHWQSTPIVVRRSNVTPSRTE